MILVADRRTIQGGKKVGAAHLEMLLILQSKGACMCLCSQQHPEGQGSEVPTAPGL